MTNCIRLRGKPLTRLFITKVQIYIQMHSFVHLTYKHLSLKRRRFMKHRF